MNKFSKTLEIIGFSLNGSTRDTMVDFILLHQYLEMSFAFKKTTYDW